MLNHLKQRKSDGFTIIEVMIVLAIAGLIMLIVFLAVPALQRNSHNTSIKNDVAGLLAGVNEFTNNNNGTVPGAIGAATTTEVTLGASGTNQAKVKVGYIDGTTVTIAAATTNVTNSLTAGQVKIYTKATCNSDGINLDLGTSSRQVAALYALEGGAKICQAS
jgi:prepilin-type N-terminal cleavage/methylation domain-containing protein